MSIHVVIGAGATGTATARLLAETGRTVKVVTRSGSGPIDPAIELIAADAANPARRFEQVDPEPPARELMGTGEPREARAHDDGIAELGGVSRGAHRAVLQRLGEGLPTGLTPGLALAQVSIERHGDIAHQNLSDLR